jgi:hypothetical protein
VRQSDGGYQRPRVRVSVEKSVAPTRRRGKTDAGDIQGAGVARFGGESAALKE